MSRLSQKWGQVLVPLLTPFDEDLKVDYEKAGNLARKLVDTGYADTIIVAGTTGEFHALSIEERVRLFEIVKEAVRGKAPVIAGTGASYTAQAVSLTKEAEKVGVDGVMVVAPYYGQPSQEGLYQYYRTVAEATTLPVLIYNIPIFTGVNVQPQTLKRLSKIENIIGTKDEAALNPTQTTEYLLDLRENFLVYCGDDTMVLATLAQGAVGVVSGGSHLIGDQMKKMINLFLGGDIEEAKRIHFKIFPLFKACVINKRVHPVPLLKAALELTGFEIGAPRPPLVPATPEEQEYLKKILNKIGLL